MRIAPKCVKRSRKLGKIFRKRRNNFVTRSKSRTTSSKNLRVNCVKISRTSAIEKKDDFVPALRVNQLITSPGNQQLIAWLFYCDILESSGLAWTGGGPS